MPSLKRKIGDVGEGIVAKYLSDCGYKIIDRNYLRKWGEIDIVAEKDGTIHFIEVKSLRGSVSRETLGLKENINEWKASVSRETVSDAMIQHDSEVYSPEDAVRLWKRQRFSRAIRTYLADRRISDEKEFLVDIAAILLDFKWKIAKIRLIENVILEE